LSWVGELLSWLLGFSQFVAGIIVGTFITGVFTWEVILPKVMQDERVVRLMELLEVHSPHWAITLTWICGIIGVFANAYNWFIALVGTTVLCIYRYLFAAMAATILPYKRPDVWEKGLRLTVAGIPLISILGLISFAWWTYIFYYACLTIKYIFC